MGKKKLDNEFIKDFYKSRGLIMLEDYKNEKTKIKCINSDGYLVVISYAKLKTGRVPMFVSIYNPYTIQNIRRWLKINRPQYILLFRLS